MSRTFYKEQFGETEQLTDIKSLIVHNDDINTFDWVIQALTDICKHSLQQAEQCTILIHYKGRASVKNGTPEELQPMKEAIADRGINVTIE